MKRHLLFLILSIFPFTTFAQLNDVPVIGWAVRNWRAIDSSYISPSHYHLSVRLLNSETQEEMKMKFDDGMKLKVRSPLSASMGVGLTYNGMGYTHSVKLKKQELANGSKKIDIGVTSSCQMFDFNFHYRRSGGDYRLKQMVLPGLGDITHPSNDLAKLFTDDETSYKDLNIGEDCSIKMYDANLNYIWNHKRFSNSANTSFSRRQIRSSGSLITGIGYGHYHISNDFGDWQSESVLLQAYSAYGKDAMRNIILSLFTDPTARQRFGQKMCSTITFTDYQANIAYAYNWVPAKNFLVSGRMTISPSLKVCRGNNEDNLFIRNTHKIAYGNSDEQKEGISSLQAYMVHMYPTIVKDAQLTDEESNQLIEAIQSFAQGREVDGEKRTLYDDMHYTYHKRIFDVNYGLRLACVWNIDRWFAGARFDFQHYRYHNNLHTKFDNTFANLKFSVGYRFLVKKKWRSTI